MDWQHRLRLRGGMTEDEQHKREVIGRLFALLTAKLEDGAELAVRGQAADASDRAELAYRLIEVSQQVTVVAEGLSLLLADEQARQSTGSLVG